MAMRAFATFSLALAAIAASAPALACSVVSDYRVPTNLELVERADLILLGKIEGGTTKIGRMNDQAMTVRPIAALKGNMPAGTIDIPGMIATGNFAVPSNPRELEQAHPLSYIGGCTRYMFVDGSTVLFFLENRDGKLAPSGNPFSRWAEDVPSLDAPWAKAVRIYATVAALPGDQRQAALIAERDALLARKDDPDAQLIAADIDRQLAGPNKPWNQLMDEEIERMRENGEDPLADLPANAQERGAPA